MIALKNQVRLFLTLGFVSFMTITHALPTETEYLGVVASAGYNDDIAWGTFPIGFSFEFFENTYTDFYVTSNGLVTFGSGSTQFNNKNIPFPGGANNYIAPFWDDIVMHSSADILYRTIGTAPNRKLVIQFRNMAFWSPPVLLGTFQVILFEGSNNIQIQYRNIVDLTSDLASGISATIGVENSNGTEGELCSYNTAGYVQSGKAILFKPDGVSYTFNENALYEGILLQDVVPRAGTTNLLSPANSSTVGSSVTFQWDAAANASGYFVVISQNSDLSSPIHTSVDLTDLSYEYTLPTDQIYYWSTFSKNSADVVSWSEIWKFQTSPAPPLVAVPQSMYIEQGEQREATLLFTGGDAGSKTVTVTSLPVEGALYQYDGGTAGAQFLTVPADVTDASFKLIYSASGATGNSAGNFDFHFSDATGTSLDESYTINVSPAGIPNFLFASKETDRIEITFDRKMEDPMGKHLEFSVKDNGVDVTSTSCILKPGDPATIVVYVSPNLNIDNAISVAFNKGTVTAESTGELESFDFQLAGKLAQVINFSALSDKSYGDTDYALSATASSGLPITFSSSNSSVVSISGTTALINNAGESLVSSFQAGNAIYAPVTYERHQLVNKATAILTLSNLSQEFTGSGIQATISTAPADLKLKVTYDGSITPPVDLGNYTVSADIEELNYRGSTTGTLTISDLTAPVADILILPDVTGECEVTPDAPTATDFYSGTITGKTATPLPITAQGITVITWIYDDGNGNTSTQIQLVGVDDVTDPVIPTLTDLTGECSATAVATTTTDACAGIITGTTTDALTYSTQGKHLITWNFDDGNGNSIDVAQNIIIEDVTAPSATCPDNFITCDGSVRSIGLTEVFDNCTTPSITYELAGATTATGIGDAGIEIYNPGETTVTYTLDDNNGNRSQCMFTVSYPEVDEIIVSVREGTLTVETAGSYQWINCKDNSNVIGQTESSFAPGESGEYAVIVTQGECSETSECYSLDYTGFDLNRMNRGIKVYPNPADRYLIIDLENENTNVYLKVVDITGQAVLTREMKKLLKTNIDVSNYKAGVYMIQISSDQMNSIIRVIKE